MNRMNERSGKGPPPQPPMAPSQEPAVLGKRCGPWTKLSAAAGARKKGVATRLDHAVTGKETDEELYAARVKEESAKISNFGQFLLAPGSQCTKITRGRNRGGYVHYEIVIECPHKCIFTIRSDKIRRRLEQHTKMCPRGDQVMHDLRAALEEDSRWSIRAITTAMATAKEKFATFESDVATFLSAYTDATELLENLWQLTSDERLGDRAGKIYNLIRKVTGRGGGSDALLPHWSWYIPKYHKIWTEIGFPDPLQKKKSAKKSTKRQKTRR